MSISLRSLAFFGGAAGKYPKPAPTRRKDKKIVFGCSGFAAAMKNNLLFGAAEAAGGPMRRGCGQKAKVEGRGREESGACSGIFFRRAPKRVRFRNGKQGSDGHGGSRGQGTESGKKRASLANPRNLGQSGIRLLHGTDRLYTGYTETPNLSSRNPSGSLSVWKEETVSLFPEVP